VSDEKGVDESSFSARLARSGPFIALFAAVVALAQLTVEGLAGLIAGSVLVGIAGAFYIVRNSRPNGVMTSIALTAVVLGSLLASGATTYVLADRRGDFPAPGPLKPLSPPASASASEPSQPVGCKPVGRFESPTDGGVVTRTKSVEGEAQICEKDTLWVFLQAADVFYVHGRQYLDVSEGRWISRSGAVECGNYRPERVTYYLLVTRSGVTEEIKVALQKAAAAQTAEFPELPSGIRLDKVDAVVDCD
jgi:hypothetical protein